MKEIKKFKEFVNESQINEAVQIKEYTGVANSLLDELVTVFHLSDFAPSLKKDTLIKVIEELIPVVLKDNTSYNETSRKTYKSNSEAIVKMIAKAALTY